MTVGALSKLDRQSLSKALVWSTSLLCGNEYIWLYYKNIDD